MPRTTISPITLPTGGATAGVTLTWTAADVTNKNQVLLTGNEILIARNTDGTNAHTVTVTSTPDALGRTGNIAADSIPANGFKVYQRFPTVGWQQSDGYLYFEASNANVQFAVLKLA